MFYACVLFFGGILVGLFFIAAGPGMDRYSEESIEIKKRINEERERKLKEIVDSGIYNEDPDEYYRRRRAVEREANEKIMNVSSRSPFRWKGKY